jgi:hypothetical protein
MLVKILKVWRLHAALFGIYYFVYIKYTAVGHNVFHCITLTSLDDAGFVIWMKWTSLYRNDDLMMEVVH